MLTQQRRTVAIIGSFRQFYPDVLKAWRAFTAAEVDVTSPIGTPIVDAGVAFVRFESDASDKDDPTIQSTALHRIFRATLTYVVAPGGYVGRTTCYEIGRLIQAKKPLYFSAQPDDLPIHVPTTHVITAEALAELLSDRTWMPESLVLNVDVARELEIDLLNEQYRDI